MNCRNSFAVEILWLYLGRSGFFFFRKKSNYFSIRLVSEYKFFGVPDPEVFRVVWLLFFYGSDPDPYISLRTDPVDLISDPQPGDTVSISLSLVIKDNNCD